RGPGQGLRLGRERGREVAQVTWAGARRAAPSTPLGVADDRKPVLAVDPFHVDMPEALLQVAHIGEAVHEFLGQVSAPFAGDLRFLEDVLARLPRIEAEPAREEELPFERDQPRLEEISLIDHRPLAALHDAPLLTGEQIAQDN